MIEYRTYNPSRDLVSSVASNGRRDTMSKEGAYALASELDQWWHSRGFANVRHYVETKTARGMIYVVRSNLVNGIPPRVEAEQKAA